MKTVFSGFPAELDQFFRGIEKNNNRKWFLKRKPLFEEKVKAPMYALIEAINQRLMRFAPDYVTDPAKAIYRFYRDTRFSADKRPYKTQIAALFYRRNQEKNRGAGLYFSVSHRGIEIAGGLYMPSPEQIKAERAWIAENYQQFRRVIAKRRFRALIGDLWGEQLSRVPKGFPRDHPAADLLRFKQWVVSRSLDPALATSPELLGELATRFRVMTPFVEFLNQPLIAARRPDLILF